MNKELLNALRAAASVLLPFQDPSPATGLKWDGTHYVPAGRTSFDPYAAKWWMALMVIAELLASQEGLIPAAQKQYLEKLLCGGMGSFNDFVLDETRLGTAASAANTALISVRREICAALRQV